MTPRQINQLKVLVSLCYKNPSIHSEGYIDVVEKFNGLRRDVGLPVLVAQLFTLGIYSFDPTTYVSVVSDEDE